MNVNAHGECTESEALDFLRLFANFQNIYSARQSIDLGFACVWEATAGSYKGEQSKVWVVAGDLPPDYFHSSRVGDATSALAAYVEICEKWTALAQAGRRVPKKIERFHRFSATPIEPTALAASALAERIALIRAYLKTGEAPEGCHFPEPWPAEPARMDLLVNLREVMLRDKKLGEAIEAFKEVADRVLTAHAPVKRITACKLYRHCPLLTVFFYEYEGFREDLFSRWVVVGNLPPQIFPHRYFPAPTSAIARLANNFETWSKKVMSGKHKILQPMRVFDGTATIPPTLENADWLQELSRELREEICPEWRKADIEGVSFLDEMIGC